MAQLITTTARSYTTGIPGRCISAARHHHIVMDDADYSGGPNEALTAAEAFLTGITACAVLMLERLARADGLPLRDTEVEIEATRDRQAHGERHTVYDSVRMRFRLGGVSREQAEELVSTYQRR